MVHQHQQLQFITVVTDILLPKQLQLLEANIGGATNLVLT
jgi:hypothetical protein